MRKEQLGKMLAGNRAVALRHFSLDTLTRQLGELLRAAGWASVS